MPMDLVIAGQRGLLPPGIAGARPVLLCEGEWDPVLREHAQCWSLDRLADATASHIDAAAELVHTQLCRAEEGPSCAGISLADLCGLELRYYLVRLLRLVDRLTDFARRHRVQRITPFFDPARDGDYAHLVRAVARQLGIPLVEWGTRDVNGDGAGGSEPRAVWRDWAAGLHRWLDSWAARRRGRHTQGLMLAGDPRLLLPIATASRAGSVDWLWPEMPWRTFLALRAAGARCIEFAPRAGATQSACDEGAGMRPLHYQGVDLAPAIASFLERKETQLGATLGQAADVLISTLRERRPESLVVDEDATPFKRLAVRLARREGVVTAVVQHGAPGVSFGFAPLAADLLFAWGATSQRRFLEWGIEPESIVPVGCPKHDDWRGRELGAPASPRQLLLFLTKHHEPARPDLVSLQLTEESHALVLAQVLHGFASLDDGWTLAIRPHPRDESVAWIERTIEQTRMGGRAHIARGGSALDAVAESAGVLSCLSSAGIEARWWDRPVVGLAPPGCLDPYPACDWGLHGSASDAASVAGLVRAMAEGRLPHPRVERTELFANFGEPAVPRIFQTLARAAEVPRGVCA